MFFNQRDYSSRNGKDAVRSVRMYPHQMYRNKKRAVIRYDSSVFGLEDGDLFEDY